MEYVSWSIHQAATMVRLAEDSIETMTGTSMRVTLGNLVDRLSIVNLKIWHCEEGLRKGLDIADEDAGRLAKQIRDLNRERVAYVNALNELDDGFLDIKVNHRSA